MFIRIAVLYNTQVPQSQILASQPWSESGCQRECHVLMSGKEQRTEPRFNIELSMQLFILLRKCEKKFLILPYKLNPRFLRVSETGEMTIGNEF